MNKKLFSWKALAGLALLVAMGLTSCNNNTVVDPNDPYNTKIPTKPSATVKDANVSVTITNLPAIWSNANGKTLNVIFSGNFKKAEKDLVVTTSKVAGAVVNFTLPATKFGFNLDASSVVANLASEGATLDKFTAKANTGKNGTTIGSGVNVAAIVPQGGDFIGTVNAVYVNANPTLVSKKGVNINQPNENIVKNLIVDGTVTVGIDNDTELGDITVLKGGNLTIGTLKAVNSIIGTKPAETQLTFASASDIAKVTLIKNMKVTNTSYIDLDNANVDNVEFAGPVDLSATTIKNVTFDDDVDIEVTGDNLTYSFEGVNFANNTLIYLYSSMKQSTSKTVETYYWDITAGGWQVVDATHPNIYAADKQVKLDVSQDGSNPIYFVNSDGTLSTELAKKVSAANNTISITTIWYTSLAPKGIVVALDKNCKQGGAAIDGEFLTQLFSTKSKVGATWFKVNCAGTMYKWTETSTGNYVLVKE